jgi:hypothetical protein
MEEDPLIRRLEIAAKVVSLAYALWMVWMLVPAARKQRAAMRAAAGTRNAAGWLASRTGAQAIGLEARTGCEPSYLVPYGLSRLRERAEGWYERARTS